MHSCTNWVPFLVSVLCLDISEQFITTHMIAFVGMMINKRHNIFVIFKRDFDKVYGHIVQTNHNI